MVEIEAKNWYDIGITTCEIDKDVTRVEYVDIEKWSETYAEKVMDYLLFSSEKIECVVIVQRDMNAASLLCERDRYFRYGSLLHCLQFLPRLKSLRIDLDGISISGTLALYLRSMGKLKRLYMTLDTKQPNYVKETFKYFGENNTLDELILKVPEHVNSEDVVMNLKGLKRAIKQRSVEMKYLDLPVFAFQE